MRIVYLYITSILLLAGSNKHTRSTLSLNQKVLLLCVLWNANIVHIRED